MDKGWMEVLVEGDPFKRIDDLLKDYSPADNALLRQLLYIGMIGRIIETKERAFYWTPVSAMLDYWYARIRYHLNATWKIVIAGGFREDAFHLVVGELRHMIEEGSLESAKYRKGVRLTFDNEWKAELLLMESLNAAPLADGEVRFALRIVNVRDWTYREEIQSIPADDPGRDLKDVTPETPIPDDDLMGQMMHDMGMIFTVPIGHAAIGDWHFEVRETEERQYAVPVEELLPAFGGCPYGYSDHMNSRYVMNERRCSCHRRGYCLGSKLVWAGTMPALARRLRELYTAKDFRSLPGHRATLAY